MPISINQSIPPSQETSKELEQLTLFRISHSLGKGTKKRIKSLGCNWNVLHHGWICPSTVQEEVQSLLQEAKVAFDIKNLSLPKGLIPTNPKIANLQTRIEILEQQFHEETMQLLTDVYAYDESLRPEDFSELPPQGKKSEEHLKIEREFHERQIALQNINKAIEEARKELLHLNSDTGDSTFDAGAPLLIAEALIQEKFLSDEIRTLHYCSSTFWRWDGTKYIELQGEEIRQILYSFLRSAKKFDQDGNIENFNPTKFRIDQVIDALKGVCYHRHCPSNGVIWLDGGKEPDPKYLICFQNGLLDLEKWMENPTTPLIPHTP